MKVREHKAHGRIYWLADLGLVDGKNVRRVFRTKGGAEQFLRSKKDEARTHGTAALALSEADRAEFLSLRARASQAGTTLQGALEFYLSRRPAEPVTLDAAIRACVASKASANRRRTYVHGLTWFLESFARGRGEVSIDTITAADVSAWLTRCKSAGSRSTWINRLSTLFSFAQRSGWVTVNPCGLVERPSLESSPPAILTLSQVLTALTWSKSDRPALLGWLVLGLFAGLRPEECDRIRWRDVDLKAGVVRVDAAASKVRQRRVVDLEPAAIKWLKAARNRGSRLPIPQSTRRKLQRELRGKILLKSWPKDVLRHTAASYLLALHQDAPKIALRLGNSPQILLRHYRELVTADDTQKFWQLTP